MGNKSARAARKLRKMQVVKPTRVRIFAKIEMVKHPKMWKFSTQFGKVEDITVEIGMRNYTFMFSLCNVHLRMLSSLKNSRIYIIVIN